MSLRIPGKQTENGDALRTRLSERIAEAVGKYFGSGFSRHVTVDKSASYLSACRTLRRGSGMSLLQVGSVHRRPEGSIGSIDSTTAAVARQTS